MRETLRTKVKNMTLGERYGALLLALVLAVGGCSDLEAPNFNAGDLDELQNNPNRSNIAAAVTGLTITTRAVYAENDNDFVAMVGILGREDYVLDVADPRFVSEMLAGELDSGSPAFGGNYWNRPYENVRLADIILTGLTQVDPTEMSQAEISAAAGFVKTWKALDLLIIVTTRDTNCDGNLGCPIAVEEDPEDLAPARTKREVYDEIERLLDEGLTDLQNAGGANFPFELHSGFAGFDTPATFIQFNRALAARVDVYLAGEFGLTSKFDEALADLDASFMDPNGDFETGVYHVFSTASGDVSNGLFQPSDDPNFRAHPSFRDSARTQTDGVSLDQRFLDKMRPVTFRTFQQVGSDIGFTIYPSIDAPVPIIRNEELLLLRAEALIGLNRLTEADDALNVVRENAGGLPPADFTLATQEQALSELLYDKRYSLWAEGGHHWIDMRRYGRLSDLPLDLDNHRVNARYPVPLSECLARGGDCG